MSRRFGLSPAPRHRARHAGSLEVTVPSFAKSGTRAGKGLTAVVTAALLTGAVPVATPTAAHAAEEEGRRVNTVLLTEYEAQLVTLVNKARTARDLRRLRVTPCAEDFARRWTKVMARKRELFHNPELSNLSKDRHCDRASYVAENIGYAWGPDAEEVFEAYMDSPGHKANILSPDARFIGIGAIALSDGQVWNTMDFTNGGSEDYGKSRVFGQGLTEH
jgi:uncharacterized protein YkwD